MQSRTKSNLHSIANKLQRICIFCFLFDDVVFFRCIRSAFPSDIPFTQSLPIQPIGSNWFEPTDTNLHTIFMNEGFRSARPTKLFQCKPKSLKFNYELTLYLPSVWTDCVHCTENFWYYNSKFQISTSNAPDNDPMDVYNCYVFSEGTFSSTDCNPW